MASVRACLLLCVLAKSSGVGTVDSGRSMPCFAGVLLPGGSKMGSGLSGGARRCGRPRAGQYLCSVARPARPPLAGVEAVTAQERATQIAEACITRDVVERLDRDGVAIVDHEMFRELAAAVLVGAQRFLPPCPSNRAAMGVRGPRELSQPTLEATQGQIVSQSPTDATRFWWHLWEIDLRFAPGLPPGRLTAWVRCRLRADGMMYKLREDLAPGRDDEILALEKVFFFFMTLKPGDTTVYEP